MAQDDALDHDDATTVDHEHGVQVRLVDALEHALQTRAPADEVAEVLERLREFTRLHFLSEELLMRRHAYARHDDHVLEHREMLDELTRLAGGDSEDRKDAIAAVRSFRARLMTHIAAHDTELTDFMSGSRPGSA